MAETLRDLRERLRRRMDELRPLVEEHHQLERAAQALGVTAPDDAAPAAKPKARSGPKAAKGRRAPRGANRAAILRLIEERPGVSVGEISGATGVARPQVYNVTRAALAAGDVEQVDLGGGRKGFKAASGDRPAAGDGGRSLEEGAEGIEDPDEEAPVGG